MQTSLASRIPDVSQGTHGKFLCPASCDTLLLMMHPSLCWGKCVWVSVPQILFSRQLLFKLRLSMFYMGKGFVVSSKLSLTLSGKVVCISDKKCKRPHNTCRFSRYTAMCMLFLMNVPEESTLWFHCVVLASSSTTAGVTRRKENLVKDSLTEEALQERVLLCSESLCPWMVQRTFLLRSFPLVVVDRFCCFFVCRMQHILSFPPLDCFHHHGCFWHPRSILHKGIKCRERDTCTHIPAASSWKSMEERRERETGNWYPLYSMIFGLGCGLSTWKEELLL